MYPAETRQRCEITKIQFGLQRITHFVWDVPEPLAEILPLEEGEGESEGEGEGMIKESRKSY